MVIRIACVVSVLAVCSPAVSAGDLAPPAGPVAPTMKTLDEVEPRIPINATNTPGNFNSLFRITAPGSYYLTSNVVGVANRHGISIASDNVTIDLMGFEMLGVPGSDSAIDSDGNRQNLKVCNGSVVSWGFDGVDLGFGEGCVIESVRAELNSAVGLSVGDAGLIRGCSAIANGSTGITAGNSSVIVDCSASANDGNGISGASYGAIVRCTAELHDFSGIQGSTGTLITQCSARANATGISVSSGGSIIGCTAAFGQGTGISGGSGCIIQGNTSYAHPGDCIRVSQDAYVVGNICSVAGNGSDGAAIHVTFQGCHIEGNVVLDSDRGIDVDNSLNLIIKNTARGNSTNYDIVAGNRVGMVVSAPASGAILGSSGGAGVGTTDPWANLSY